MDAETREALEALRRNIADVLATLRGMLSDDAITGRILLDPEVEQLDESLALLAHIEQTLRDLSEQRDEARKERSDAVTTAARAMERSAALAERVERAERALNTERRLWGADIVKLRGEVGSHDTYGPIQGWCGLYVPAPSGSPSRQPSPLGSRP